MKSCCLTTLSLCVALFGLQWSLLPVLNFCFSHNLLFQKKGRTWKNLLYQFADQGEHPLNDQPEALWPSLLLRYQRLWRGAKKGWLITRDCGMVLGNSIKKENPEKLFHLSWCHCLTFIACARRENNLRLVSRTRGSIFARASSCFFAITRTCWA